MVELNGHTFEFGGLKELHSLPLEHPPTVHVRPFYFWSTDSEAHQIGGLGSRPIFVHGRLNKDWNKADDLFDYTREVDNNVAGGGEIGELTVRKKIFNVQQERVYDGCYLVKMVRIPQEGQTHAAPLYDAAGGLKWWIDVILLFMQVP